MTGKRTVHFAVVALLLLTACGDDEPTHPPGGTPAAFSGIVRTDIDGQLIEDDPADWQPRCPLDSSSTSPVCAFPGHPNPAPLYFDTRFDLARTAAVSVVARVSPDSTVRRLIYPATEMVPGAHVIRWDLRADSGELLPAGVYRVFIRVAVPGDPVVHEVYGDVQIIR